MKHIVIMAGGSGTRFWPKSTNKNPKQFLKLFGKRSMIQMTFDRIAKLAPKKNISVVCAPQFAKLSKKHLPGVKVLSEPEPRNTMAAVCLTAWSCYKTDPNAVVCVLPADAYIADVKGFQDILKKCFEFSERNDFITCIGIKPNFPATGYGYIEAGNQITHETLEISRFVEKPDLHKAQSYVESGKYFWNAGIFVFKAEVFIQEVKKHAPLYFEGFEKAKSATQIKSLFKKLPKEAVDTALMEKTSLGAVVAGSFGWNDVGAWPALCEVVANNCEAGVILRDQNNDISDCLSVDSSGVVASLDSKKFLGLVGVKDLVIVETADALLICSKDKAQEIKTLVSKIQNSKFKKLL